jgi:hypothetical protein
VTVVAMLSESARMSSAAEARFRVQAPNSTPRAIKVVALDAASEPILRRLAEDSWNRATFFRIAQDSGGADLSTDSSGGMLTDLSGHVTSVNAEVNAADLVIMVAAPGGHARAASLIGQACSLRRVMTTTLIVGDGAAPDEGLSKTLAQVRPWSLMLVIAGNVDYIKDMMTALRA